MPLQVLSFILLFGAIQGLLLVGVLLRRQSLKPYHVFLCAYIVIILFQVVLKCLSKGWVMNIWNTGYSLSYYLPYLYGPFVYFMAHASVADYTFKPKHLLHFLPFFLFMVLFSLDKNITDLPVFSFLFTPWVRLVLQLGSLVTYHIIAKKVLDRFQKRRVASYMPVHIDFSKKFILVSLASTVLISFIMYFMYVTFPDYKYLKWSFVLLTLFIYWMSFQVFQKPGSFEVLLGNSGALAQDESFRSKLTILHTANKYVNSSLKDNQAAEIAKSLNTVMDTRRLFLEPTLTIDKLADILCCHKHHLSQVLNEKLGTSFNDYINHHRIEASKEMLSSPDKAAFTIASIAYDAGFNSLSTFNDVFKKLTGITPSHFRKVAVKESRQQRI